jgi:hypothetical protein
MGNVGLCELRLDLNCNSGRPRAVLFMDPTTPCNTTCPLPESTPIKVTTATLLPFTTNQKFRNGSCSALATEIRSHLLGPMPAQSFLDEFFPTRSCPRLSIIPIFTKGCYNSVLDCKLETQAYNPFVGSNSILPTYN